MVLHNNDIQNHVIVVTDGLFFPLSFGKGLRIQEKFKLNTDRFTLYGDKIEQ